jgi:anhydro-N-acetylmuramic acid kinase
MFVLGLMSGTSADGLDAALCDIRGEPTSLSVKLIRGHSIDYTPEIRAAILAACQPATGGVDSLCRLNFSLAEIVASEVSYIKQLTSITPDLIASHGQTVWHDVAPDGRVTSTLQIVEAAVIAERTGVTTISNFRARDVAAGGQGAPLVAYVDSLLLRGQTGWRAIQNLGGIGNVTFLAPHPLNPSLSNVERGLGGEVSFDTGPANVLIDHAARVFTGQPYDVDGALAAAGRIDEGWLADLLDHAYFHRTPPKTTGRELYTASYADGLLMMGRIRGLSPADITATLTALTAASLADQYRRFAPAPITEVIIGGGGTRNPTLMAMIRQFLAPARVITSDEAGVDSRYKEAIAFAVLGYESWHQRAGVGVGQTGARRPTVLGDITPGDNFVSLIHQTWGI